MIPELRRRVETRVKIWINVRRRDYKGEERAKDNIL